MSVKNPINSIRNGITQAIQLGRTFGRELLFFFRFFPRHTTALFAAQFLVGVIPAVHLYIAAGIIDEIVRSAGSTAWWATSHLFWLVILELCVLGIQRFAFLVNEYLINYLRGGMMVVVNDRIHRKMIQLDLPTLERADIQTIVTFLKENSWRPKQMVYLIFEGFGNLVASFSLFAITFAFSPFFAALFVLAIVPSVAISVRAIYAGHQLAWGKAALMKKVWYFDSLFRGQSSLIELAVHSVGKYFADHYKRSFQGVAQKEVAIEKRKLVGKSAANVVAFAVYVLVYLRIVSAAVSQALSLGQFTLFAGAFVNLERFIVSQAWQISALIEHVKYLDAFSTLERLSPAIRDVQGAEALEAPLNVEFLGVAFRYPNAQRDAVSSLSFAIHPGERIAFVGENGAGKSTVVKLLLRLYEPTSGQILINGKDYRRYTLSSLRKRIGVTFQDFLKFSLPARENIAVGELDYAEQMQAIERAAQQAGVHERITRLPKGYEKPLGHGFEEGGVELSGGEWQKVALARSLIKDASLLILDEPTAALDARSEYEFFKELFRRAKKQSILLISHRFSSVRVADRIIVLKDGKIAEQGTHGELMKKKGLYEELYTLQTKEIS